MASSELEIEPDLRKAPPHVEGELLKQGTQSIFGHKSWKKFFFIVLKDKFQYFLKRDDHKQNKEAVAYIRISQVTSITEVVFNGVPKTHHLNCGFTVEAFHPVSQQKVTLNLLAETPEDMRYWVFAMRYIKAYYSKMKIRETVLNEETEKIILAQLLSGGVDEDGEEDQELIPGKYSLEDGGVAMADEGSGRVNVSVYLADGLKVKVNMASMDTTSDLLEREEVKKHLTSSTAHVWLVDSLGNDMILKPDDHPALFPGKLQKLFALDHAHRVLPVFFNKKDFECIIVLSTSTAAKIIEHHDLSVKLDLNGVTNCGMFLKSTTEELMFDLTECPCDILFDVDEEGHPTRQPVGKLVVHNKSLGGGRSTFNTTRRLKKPRGTVYKPKFRTTNEEQRILEETSEKEQAQSKALDLLLSKKKAQKLADIGVKTLSKGPHKFLGPISQTDVEIDGEQWVVASEGKNLSTPTSAVVAPSPQHHMEDNRGLEDSIISISPADMSPGKNVEAGTMGRRQRSSAMSAISTKEKSPVMSRKGGKLEPKLRTLSPPGSPRRRLRSRSRSPGRRLPVTPVSGRVSPPDDYLITSMDSPYQHRNKTSGSLVVKSSPTQNTSGVRSYSLKSNPVTVKKTGPIRSSTLDHSSSSPPSLTGKGPTIRFSGEEEPTSPSSPSSPTPNSPTSTSPTPWDGRIVTVNRIARSHSIRTTFVEGLSANKSRSSMFGLPHSSSTTPAGSHVPVTSAPHGRETYQRTHPTVSNTSESNGHSSSYTPTLDNSETTPTSQKPEEDLAEAFCPFVIDFKALQMASQPLSSTITEEKKAEAIPLEGKFEGESSPINVTTPNLLKVILLQSSEAHEETASIQPMDFIILSGVALRNKKGVWSLQDGYNFHIGLPADSDDHTETFRLTGGIRAIYNHTQKCWHVLSPSGPVPLSSLESSLSDAGSTERAQNDRAVETANALYLSKKVLVTEVGSAFHAIMDLFGETRSVSSKKRIGSDMTNQAMGHLIRGRFCSALSHLMLDGLRPYRLQGIVQDDIWKVTVAFCNAASSDRTSLLSSSSMDKIILQPINALRTAMKDSHVKFRTFVSLAMSKGMLTGWLETLPKLTNVLHKYYQHSAFLMLVSENDTYFQLYQEMLLTLEPMLYLPFDLSIDFESHHTSPAVDTSNGQYSPSSLNAYSALPDVETSSSNSSPSTSSALLDQSASQLLRASVVIKTHAATGQRTASGNVLSAVWEASPITSPTPSPTHSIPVHRINTSVSETDVVQGPPQISRESVQEEGEWESQYPMHLSLEQFQPAVIKGKFMKLRGSLMKTFSDGFQHLNKGGAILGDSPGMGNPSGMEDQIAGDNHTPKLMTTPQPTATTGERVVEALYTNVCDDADELCFQKGDHLIVKEQINDEWLICSDGSKTGIVPVNYITLVS